MQSVVRNSCTNLYSNPGSLLNDNGKEDTEFVGTHEDNELGLCALIHKLECSSSTAPSCYHICVQTAEVGWKVDNWQYGHWHTLAWQDSQLLVVASLMTPSLSAMGCHKWHCKPLHQRNPYETNHLWSVHVSIDIQHNNMILHLLMYGRSNRNQSQTIIA
jgi:hypothetical protein